DIPYTITVKNQGNQPANGVVLRDIVPPNTTFVSMSAVTGWVPMLPAPGSTGTVEEDADHPLAPNESATFTLTLHINPATTSGTKIDNTASVAPVANELSAMNNSSTFENTVQSQADVTITKDDGVTTIDAGSMVTYTITVTNTGPSAVI